MKRLILTGVLALIWSLSMEQNIPNAAYPYDPSTETVKSSAAGEIIERKLPESKIYPGTNRNYWIYVPALFIFCMSYQTVNFSVVK